jgi:outer membrane protein OmpA-like peptidoglycan-associated protein
MRTVVGCGLAITLVLCTGCATREWVHEVVAERDALIDQKVAGVERSATTAAEASNEARERLARDQAARVDALAARLGAIEEAVAEARETSRIARSRADEAMARAEAADSRLTKLWARRHARTPVNFLQIRFGFDTSALDDPSKSALVALAHELRDNPTLTVDLEGYADSKGSREYNLRLSRRRIEAVQRYLEEQGVEGRRISGTARGPVTDPAQSDERKRRVVVKIMLDAD